MTATPTPQIKTDVEFYQELIAALDTLPRKELIRGVLKSRTRGYSCYCAIGAMMHHAQIPVAADSTCTYARIAEELKADIRLVRTVLDVNDLFGVGVEISTTLQRERWQYVRDWAEARLRALTLTEGT